MAETKQTQTPPVPPAPDPAVAELASLRLALLERADLSADAAVDDETLLAALDEKLTAPAATDEPTMEKRTVQHNLFSYDLPAGGQAMAMRGETVDLLPHDVAKGERFNAFTAKPGTLPEPAGSTLPAFPVDGSEAEQEGWVSSGSVQEILNEVALHPETLSLVIAAEQRRADASRKTLLDALGKMNGGI
jgi:hypothetical protein